MPSPPGLLHYCLWLAASEPMLWVKDNSRRFDAPGHGRELFQLFRHFHPHGEGIGVGLYLFNRLLFAYDKYLEVYGKSAKSLGTPY